MSAVVADAPAVCGDIPLPIVALNRWTLVTGIVAGFVLQQPWLTTVLFLILVPAVLIGQRASLIFQVGTRVLAAQNARAEREDRRLMRFNNSIAVVLLGLAQGAFLLGVPVVGWGLSGLVALAASIALAGFCIGCFLYHQLGLARYRLRRWRASRAA